MHADTSRVTSSPICWVSELGESTSKATYCLTYSSAATRTQSIWPNAKPLESTRPRVRNNNEEGSIPFEFILVADFNAEN